MNAVAVPLRRLSSNPVAAALVPAGVLFFLFMVTRIVLAVLARNELDATVLAWARTWWSGVRLDVVMALVFSLPWAILFSILPDRTRAGRWFPRALSVAWFAFLFAFLFVAALEVAFFDEFDARFNSIAVDYLIYPTEVAGNIWQSYPVVRVVLAVGALAWAIHRATARFFTAWAGRAAGGRKRGLGVGAMALLLAAAILLAPPVAAEISVNRVQNEIAGNGPAAFFYAFWSNDLPYDHYYRTIPKDEAAQRVRRLLADSEAETVSGGVAGPLDRREWERGALDRPNFVVLIEESFGANFTGVLGRHPENLTPCFDRLAAGGILFTNFYATGSRTVRGLEAILCGFPPVPGESIVKRHRSEKVYSFARALKDQGYETLFVYGGRGIFDNMRPFLRANGFDRFIEQKDFARPTFTTAWGVCDEDIFDRALEEFDAQHATGRRFFAAVLSVSNHKPYTYPAGRIDLDPQRRRREHAVKYADYALGRFFDKARGRPFFKNTVFVVIGDHGARVYGADFIPIRSYEVPFLIYAPGMLKPKKVDVLGSSLDIAPTLMGLTNMHYQSVFFGRDLWDVDPATSYALMQHDRDVGILREGRLAVLGLHRTARVFKYDRASKFFSASLPLGPEETELVRDGVALYQTAYDLYQNRRYHVPDAPVLVR
ncbi:MAG TPA: LTA synthase family protein [Elusimicrobiota bacterium]|nr:LTA synthase family protein [Elusimicrobiota bacterium]